MFDLVSKNEDSTSYINHLQIVFWLNRILLPFILIVYLPKKNDMQMILSHYF